MLPFVMLSSSWFMDIWRCRQNISIDFIIWVCLPCENKKGIKLGFAGALVLLYLSVRLCASDRGYSFLFVTDEKFSKCRNNRANTKTSSTP